MAKQRNLDTPQLSEPNVRGLYRTAKKFNRTMSRLLNYIVTIALEELSDVGSCFKSGDR